MKETYSEGVLFFTFTTYLIELVFQLTLLQNSFLIFIIIKVNQRFFEFRFVFLMLENTIKQQRLRRGYNCCSLH